MTMSVLRHKDPANPRQGWNHFRPLRLDQVDRVSGSEEGLTRLVDALHGRQFRILHGLVPHGGQAPIARSHPEWWTYNRDGSRRRGWGQAGLVKKP